MNRKILVGLIAIGVAIAVLGTLAFLAYRGSNNSQNTTADAFARNLESAGATMTQVNQTWTEWRTISAFRYCNFTEVSKDDFLVKASEIVRSWGDLTVGRTMDNVFAFSFQGENETTYIWYCSP